MNLADSSARPIHVRFKLLDQDTPEGVDELYSEPFLAQFRVAKETGLFTVTIPGSVAEKLMASQKSQPGSFSEFVWTFDSASGEVVSAAVSGILNQTVDLGFFDAEMDAKIEIQMDTLASVGKSKPRNLLGHNISKFCADAADEECQPVDPVDYDSRTGFVKAVGSLSARTSIITTRTIAPLGTAIFSEASGVDRGTRESASLPSDSTRSSP